MSVRGAVSAVVGVALSACSGSGPLKAPPDRFYYPAGLAHLDAPASDAGVLLVANGDFDKRFGAGTFMAVDLDRVSPPLPPFGQAPAAKVPQIGQLSPTGTTPAQVQIAPFAGEVAVLAVAPQRFRAFVPTRSERMRLFAIDVSLEGGGVALSCHQPGTGAPEGDCVSGAPQLSPLEFEQSASGVPRAPGPYGVGVRARACGAACPTPGGCDCGDQASCAPSGVCQRNGEVLGDVFVTHVSQADSPVGSGTNARGYVVRLDSFEPKVTQASFIGVDAGATSSVAVGRRWAYVSGRYLSPTGDLIRLVSGEGGGTVRSAALQDALRVAEARGIALSADERRVYLVGRAPDVLVIGAIEGAESDAPSIRPVRSIPLPEGPNDVKVLARPGRSDLVAISCTAAGVVVLYDDDVGNIVSQVSGVGVQPFALAVDQRGAGARLYVGNFQDGRVAVIDVPELARPHTARLVAHLGQQQLCVTRGTQEAACDGGAQ